MAEEYPKQVIVLFRRRSQDNLLSLHPSLLIKLKKYRVSVVPMTQLINTGNRKTTLFAELKINYAAGIIVVGANEYGKVINYLEKISGWPVISGESVQNMERELLFLLLFSNPAIKDLIPRKPLMYPKQIIGR